MKNENQLRAIVKINLGKLGVS